METGEIRHALQLIQNAIEFPNEVIRLKEAWNLLSEHITKLEDQAKSEHPQEADAEEILKATIKKHSPKDAWKMIDDDWESNAGTYFKPIVAAMTEYADLKSKEARNKALQEAIDTLIVKGVTKADYNGEIILSELEKLKQ
jgi:phosphoketolase